jgi:hypothetical protein
MILDPFLNLLHTRLRGLKIGTEQRKVTCIAHADDVSVILRDTNDVNTLNRILQIFKEAVGAKVNCDKCSGLPIGNWDQTQKINNSRYVPTTKILGIYYGTTIANTIEYTWKEKVNKIQGLVKEAYTRNLNIQQRMWVSNV